MTPIGWGSILTGAAALIVGIITVILNRRTADDSHTIQLINAGQSSLKVALDRATVDIANLQKKVDRMQTELTEANAQLSETLQHHRECEDARVEQAAEIARLRRQLEGTNGS